MMKLQVATSPKFFPTGLVTVANIVQMFKEERKIRKTFDKDWQFYELDVCITKIEPILVCTNSSTMCVLLRKSN